MKNAMKKVSLLMVVLLILTSFLAACGGDKGNKAETGTTTAAQSTAATTEAKPEPSPEPTPEVSASPTPEAYKIGDITVQANMQPQPQYTAANTLDGNLDDESRWSAECDWAYLTFDLGEEKKVKSLDIAFAMAEQQQTTFDIAISKDGKDYAKVLMQQTCEGKLGFQNFAFEFVQLARYVRVIGHYNNTADWAQWISISEVVIKDDAGNKIDVKEVTANKEPQENYKAINTIDGDIGDESRWSAEVGWAYLTYDLGTEKVVESVDIAFAMVEQQQTTFDIAVSNNGVDYNKVLMQQTCEPKIGFQNFKFEFAMPARYVRVIGHYNNTADWAQWISISEVKINTK